MTLTRALTSRFGPRGCCSRAAATRRLSVSQLKAHCSRILILQAILRESRCNLQCDAPNSHLYQYLPVAGSIFSGAARPGMKLAQRIKTYYHLESAQDVRRCDVAIWDTSESINLVKCIQHSEQIQICTVKCSDANPPPGFST